MKKLIGALGAALSLSGLVLGLLIPAPASAAEPVLIQPEAIARGADLTEPQLVGRRIIDGDRVIRVPGRFPRLHGRSGSGYVVDYNARGQRGTYLLGYGPSRLIAPAHQTTVRLAGDGKSLSIARYHPRVDYISVRIQALPGGREVGRTAIRPDQSVIDVRGFRAVIGGSSRGGLLWDAPSGRTRRLKTGIIHAADIAADRIAYFHRDPSRGGCTRVATLTRPRAVLWASCREAVVAFSPAGRLLTMPKLSDGVGPARLWERGAGGGLRASYAIRRGYFGDPRWESDTAVLFKAYGRRSYATIRCTAGVCERATRLRPSPPV